MSRIRTIHPRFASTPAMGRIGREARLLFILMWTVADDAGRLRFDSESLIERLFPFDTDAAVLLPAWLDELERARCIERYCVEGVDYLRVRQWRKLQTIDRPTRSRLPASPAEALASREAREAREEADETAADRASGANPREDFFDDDASLLGGPRPITPERVTADLDRLQRKAESRNAHTAAARYTELMGRQVGLWGGRGAPTGRREPAEPLSPSPGQLLPREQGA